MGTKNNLNREEWVQAAWDFLIKEGISNFKLTTLCQILGVTKGSFYWHFKDRDELLNVLLQEWERRSTQRFIEMVNSYRGHPKEAFTKMIQAVVATRNIEIDHVFREWAALDSRAENLVKKIDERRLNFLRDIFQRMGFTEEEADTRAILLYYYAIGVAFAKAVPEDPEERMHRVNRIIQLITS